jgi:hypothetical protein
MSTMIDRFILTESWKTMIDILIVDVDLFFDLNKYLLTADDM